jgi:hypothetical protein
MSARTDDSPVFPGAGRRPATPRQGGGPPWTPLAALAALLLAACAPAIDFGRATTLAAGEVRYSGGAELSILAADLRPDQPVPLPWANLSAGVHAGLTDRVEVGGRAWGFGWPGLFTTFGLAADAKYQITRSRFTGDPNVATGLSLGWHSPALGNQPWTVFSATAPLLVGFDIGKSQLVFGPRAAGYYATSYGQRAIWTGAVGGGVGWSVRLGHAEIFPEVLWMWSPLNWDGALHQDDRYGARGLHAGVAFSWHPPPKAP